MVTRIIGIDFGTSTSVVKVFNNGGGDNIFTLNVSNGIQEIPTIIFLRKEDGQVFIADEALNQIAQSIEGITYRNFKLGLISDDSEQKAEAIRLTTLFFRYLHKKYEEMCNTGDFGKCDTTKVYISYPAKWPSFARMDMFECAKKAGFGDEKNIFGLDEPTAAAVASLHEKAEDLKMAGLYFENTKYKAMMIDMGAGTTDIVLFEYIIEKGSIHINNPVTYPTADSVRLCGGHEIDDVLSEYCINYCKNIPTTGTIPQGLIDKCISEAKTWKEQSVSVALKDNLEIKTPGFIAQQINMMKAFGMPVNTNLKPFSINRLTFESLTQTHWSNWRNMISEAFEEGAKYGYKSPDDINVVILNGGHSQWYGVKDFLLGKSFAGLSPLPFKQVLRYPQSLIQSIKPSQTVATGLCLRDKAIVAATPIANNIWVQFEYEGKHSNVIKLADKGHPLPFSNTLTLPDDTIKGNFIWRKEFNIKCKVFEGKDLDTAKTFVKSFQSPSDDLLSSLIKTIIVTVLGSPIAFFSIIGDLLNGTFKKDKYSNIIDHDYKIKIAPKVSISEDGIATVSSNITIDGEKVYMPVLKI